MLKSTRSRLLAGTVLPMALFAAVSIAQPAAAACCAGCNPCAAKACSACTACNPCAAKCGA